MINDKESLLKWKHQAGRQPEGRIVLDLEADSLHRYKQKICLIQYADDAQSCLIDPLSIEDMRPFSAWLEEATVWMHGADYDMSLFLMTWGILPRMIFDTQTAARFLGFRQFGLAALVEHFFGVKLSKASQKADWAKRPLPGNMAEYAINDVRYILEMADIMTAQLKEKNRYGWFLESCSHALEKGRQRHEAEHPDPWRIRGSGKLNRKGLAALKCLWNWRDKEAVLWDKPAFMVCSNDDLINWSTEMQNQREPLPLTRFHPQRRERFLGSIRKFYSLDEDEYPERPQHIRKIKSPEFDDKLAELIRHRDGVAEQLGIEPAFLAARYILEAMAEDREKGMTLLLHWQKEALGYAPALAQRS